MFNKIENIKKFCYTIVSICKKKKANIKKQIQSACYVIDTSIKEVGYFNILVLALKEFGQTINEFLKDDKQFLDKMSDLELISLMLTITAQNLQKYKITKKQKQNLLNCLCKDKDLAEHIINITEMVSIDSKKLPKPKNIVMQLAKKIGGFLGYFAHDEDFDIHAIITLIQDSNTVYELTEITFFFFEELQNNYYWQMDKKYQDIKQNLKRERDEIKQLLELYLMSNLQLTAKQINDFKAVVVQFMEISGNMPDITIMDDKFLN